MHKPKSLDSPLVPRLLEYGMRARTATPVEWAELWPRLVELSADFESYQSWTDREIPVVICEPVAP